MPQFIKYTVNLSNVSPFPLSLLQTHDISSHTPMEFEKKNIKPPLQGLTTSRLPKVASIAMNPAEQKEEIT